MQILASILCCLSFIVAVAFAASAISTDNRKDNCSFFTVVTCSFLLTSLCFFAIVIDLTK
jgi:hypothetical protein